VPEAEFGIRSFKEFRFTEIYRPASWKPRFIMPLHHKPSGIYAPTITGFNADESLNEKGTRAFVRYLLDSGVHGLAPMGSAGEFCALSDEERMQAMEWILDEVNGQVPVYAGTGHYSTATTIKLSRHALKNGANGILIMPPYLLRPPKEDVLDHFRRIREAVPLPIMVYDVPILAGVEVTPQEIHALAKEDVIHSVKWSHVEVTRIHDTRLLCGSDFPVFVGIDLIALEGLAVEADGYISGLPMMVPRLARKLFETVHDQRDLEGARSLWNRLLPLVRFEYRALTTDAGQPHWLAVCREAAALRGIPVGASRLPLRALSNELREELRRLLHELGEI
jgi:4-hydroxy-tetrahydrodipicolinate synthase